MSVLVLLECKVQADKLDDFTSFLGGVIADTRSYDGCESITIEANQDDPADIAFVERWESREKYEAYFAWRTETGVVAELGAMLAGDPSIRYFEDTGL